MNREQLTVLFEMARQLSGHDEFVVIGSLSVLGLEEGGPIPDDMSRSIDVNCFTRSDPERVFDLIAPLGESSAFHAEHGFYLDPVSPRLPSLPDGWEARLNRHERDGLRIWFLEPNDAAISKYARCEPRDLRWIRAGILSGLVSLPVVRARIGTTSFIDDSEARRVRSQVDADTAWFETIRKNEAPGTVHPQARPRR